MRNNRFSILMQANEQKLPKKAVYALKAEENRLIREFDVAAYHEQTHEPTSPSTVKRVKFPELTLDFDRSGAEPVRVRRKKLSEAEAEAEAIMQTFTGPAM